MESCLSLTALVEKVVLLGAPIPIMHENWEATRKGCRRFNFLLNRLFL